MRLQLLIIGFILGVVGFSTSLAQAQIKPGKEKLLVQLDPAYKWKSSTEKSEFNSIRKTTFKIQGKQSIEYPIQLLELTTIDKRYYTIKARAAAMDKLKYYQSQCQEIVLDLRQQGVTENGSFVIYILQAPIDVECMDHVFLGLAVDGPTAFHGIEIKIPKEKANAALLEQWVALLSEYKIQ